MKRAEGTRRSAAFMRRSLGASEAAIIAARISSSSTAVYGSTVVSTARFWVRIHRRL
ncbi:hypothetical protein [Mycobacterium sp.]|uniref:hypothetical protein n=1 Tax=Mycobacterium sp. TaxID=1785 RepID=UPI0033416D6D